MNDIPLYWPIDLLTYLTRAFPSERPRGPDVHRPGGGAVRDGHPALGLPAGRHQGLRGPDRANAASQHGRGRGRKGTPRQMCILCTDENIIDSAIARDYVGLFCSVFPYCFIPWKPSLNSKASLTSYLDIFKRLRLCELCESQPHIYICIHIHVK